MAEDKYPFFHFFHTIILPLFFFPGVASCFFILIVILTSIPLQPG
nr:MAG TPA: hypothetical protein [Caudoviricetes sp.]